MLAVLSLALCAAAQPAQNLLQNGDFERGTEGWLYLGGGYGRKPVPWQAPGARAKLVRSPVKSGRAALCIDATDLPDEVDVVSQPIPVKEGFAYLLQAWVVQQAGEGAYKVTIDWQTAQGRHIAYDNDWKGHNRPKKFTAHGGAFVAPNGAARAVIILGVANGVKCVFDRIVFAQLGRPEPVGARPRRNGDGQVRISGPQSVPAGGHATWRVVYKCGKSGMPVGGRFVLWRWPISHDWSPAQSTDPQSEGFVRVLRPKGAIVSVSTGRAAEINIVWQWPCLKPGEEVEIVLGDTSAGGPGMRVQRTACGKVRWLAGSDCNADGQWLELSKPVRGGEFEVTPAQPEFARVLAPSVIHTREAATLRVELVDRFGNRVPSDAVATLRFTPWAQVPRAKIRGGVGKSSVYFSRTGLFRVAAILPSGRVGPETWTVVALKPGQWQKAARGKQTWAVQADWGCAVGNRQVAAVMPQVPGFGFGPIEIFCASDGKWRRVAVMPAPARVAFEPSSAPVPGKFFFASKAICRASPGLAVARLNGDVVGNGARWMGRCDLKIRAESSDIEFHFSLRAPINGQLYCMHSPLLYVADGSAEESAGAIFPGLEFLGPGEASSSDAGVAWRLRERWIPHPYKITVPVMAVAASGCVVGLAWDPLQKWDGQHPVPLAHFASPNRREGRPNHLLALIVPGLTDGFRENRPGPAAPVRLEPGRELSVQARIFVLPGTEDVARAIEYRTRLYGLPLANPPRTPQAAVDLAMEGFSKVAWDEKAGGWLPAIGKPAGFHPATADCILLSSLAWPGRPAVAAARRQFDRALDMRGWPAGAPMNLRIGSAEDAIETLRAAAYSAMRRQRADGSWRFADVYSRQGLKATLALPEDVNLGTCVNALEPVLRYAAASGDPRAIEAGLKGLDFIKRFHKPAGSESWEVPLCCPNLRAAALAVRCFLYGYLLTGRREYLALARRWAWAGAAFIYQWRAPDRPQMPGASISVFGTTFYTHPWFGAAVQWVGLVFAEALEELSWYEDSFDWHRLARLILCSAIWQQKKRSAKCGHVGFLPDSFHLVRGRDYYEWCLAPTGIVRNCLAQLGFWPDVAPWSAAFDRGRLYFLSPAAPRNLRASSDSISVSLRYVPGQACQAILFGAKPSVITWRGRTLPKLDSIDEADEGWAEAQLERAVVLKLGWVERSHRLVLAGLKAIPCSPPKLPDRLLNPGFEEGLRHWHAGAGCKISREDVHSGRACLLISAPDPSREAQASSRCFAVTGGTAYRLRAWVRQISGTGPYKVTIEWLTEAGEHIRYDNDWRGHDRPREWSAHGGVFESPANAAKARIILGCRGAVCAFDDVSLAPAP